MEKRQRGNRWHPELCLDLEDVKPLWEEGLSTRQIGERLGYSGTIVHRICKKNGLIRSQRDAAILRQPPTSKHWRSSRQSARKKVEAFLGRKLMRQEHVHHRDHDFTNNDIDNLEMLNASEHAKLHHPLLSKRVE